MKFNYLDYTLLITVYLYQNANCLIQEQARSEDTIALNLCEFAGIRENVLI